jgi:GT2 family glycosyltransferase
MASDEFAAVVIGRNEGDRLVACFKSVQPTASCVVYVDSGSTDDSKQTAEQLGIQTLSLDPRAPFTAARARNEGFELVRQINPAIQFVQFIDGDCELVDGWLTAAIDFMKHHGDVALVCGRRRERYVSGSIYNKLCDFEWDTPVGQTSACGGDALVRAEAFESVGGYRAQLIAGEEPELCLRLSERGWKIWRIATEMTLHDAAMTRFSQWWVRTVRYGYGITQLLWLHGRTSSPLWKRQFARSCLWGGLLPGAVLLASLMHPTALLIFAIYPLQVCRIAVTKKSMSTASWIYASYMVLAKFAEFQGVIKFYWIGLRRQPREIIEYK